jgi:hypothetical protein
VNNQNVVQDLLTSHKAMGCNMNLKSHLLESHLDFFPEAKSVMNTVKNFTKTLWLWKSCTTANDLKYVGRLLLDTERDVPEAKHQ